MRESQSGKLQGLERSARADGSRESSRRSKMSQQLGLLIMFLLLLGAPFSMGGNYSCYCFRKLVSDLMHPITVIPVPGFEDSLLVGEHLGVIKLIESNSDVSIFLNISHKVLTSHVTMDERGLLSFVLDPDFRANGYLYLCYSAHAKSRHYDHRTVIARFRSELVHGTLQGLSHSEKVILEIDQPKRNNNGGQLLFGLHNYLYITTGDGGGDNVERFNKASLLGKVLRLDVRWLDRRDDGRPYDIPPDNPFKGRAGVREEIFAYGFRNPWRCAIDVLPTASEKSGYRRSRRERLICGDTSTTPHREEEEILVVKSGRRYGWMDLKNSVCRSVDECRRMAPNIPSGDELPVFTYARDNGQAVVGGIVYNGAALTSLQGKYLYADFIHGSIHALTELNDEYQWESEDLCVRSCHDGRDISKIYITSIMEDHEGEPLILATNSLSNTYPGGSIYRLESLDLQHNSGYTDLCIVTKTVALSIILLPFVVRFLRH